MTQRGSWLLGVVLLGACNTILGNEEPVRFQGDTTGGSANKGGSTSAGTAGSSSDAGEPGTGGSVNGGASAQGGGGNGSAGEGGEGGGEPMGSDFAPCNPTDEALEEFGFFVSPDGVDNGSDGSKEDPFQTIQYALERADVAGKAVVFVAEGTYDEAIHIGEDTGGGVTLEGGWIRDGATWTKDCEPDFVSRTLIASPTNIGVLVTGTTATTAIEHLTIMTKAVGNSPVDGPGESMYGLFVTGDNTDFRLMGVTVLAGDGGMGGPVSAPEQVGALACDGISDCGVDPTPPPGGVGNAGLDAPTTGSFGPSGYGVLPGEAGTNGDAGDSGAVGQPGQEGLCDDACDCSCTTGCGACGNPETTYGPTGRCGCGGAGGVGGPGGPGGGASIAVFLAGDNLYTDLAYVTLSAGLGGDGAQGAPGGLGGDATAPAFVGPATCRTGCSTATVCGSNDCVAQETQLSPGTEGSWGAVGGQGGPGGGGPGGPSYALVVYSSTGQAPVDQTVTALTFGARGNGFNAAAAGTDGEQLFVD